MKEIQETKFFSVVVNSSLKEGRETITKPISNKGEIDFKLASRNIDYLEDLIGEMEKRKLLAVMSMTPDKIIKSSATSLAWLVKSLDASIAELRGRVNVAKNYVGGEVKKSNNLSDEDRERIEKFLNR